MHKLYLLLSMACLSGANAFSQDSSITVPVGGNTWSTREKGGQVTKDGTSGWTDMATGFATYFRVSRKGAMHLWVDASAPGGSNRIRISMGNLSRDLSVDGAGVQRYDAGEWTLRDTGYQVIRLSGIDKSGAYFAQVHAFVISGPALDGPMAYVPNDEGNFFYWGRRGPSVHLGYDVPKDMSVEWFYNEVTVPVGQDLEGSYFMADGFGQGYFGMQVNSPTERHILFSVWSPFETDDPKSIPDSLRIVLLSKGAGVHAGSFGNEGSGGQSYLNYLWKAGDTYRFLLRGKPLDDTHTAFTAWFFAPEDGYWRLIASWSRPRTHTWLTGLHSFLENFDPEQGDKTRLVLFSHQWVGDAQGNWAPVDRARFTGDNTARKGYRQDYAGGVRENAFFLKNAGFFNDRVPMNTWFNRPRTSTEGRPNVDLSKLP
jgi:hypothetical protein